MRIIKRTLVLWLNEAQCLSHAARYTLLNTNIQLVYCRSRNIKRKHATASFPSINELNEL